MKVLGQLMGQTIKDGLDLKWALAVAAEAIINKEATLDEVVDQLNTILDPKGEIQGIEIRESLKGFLEEREKE